jgi:putative YhdH/YhfP family quinone oxidoreductase
MGNFKAFVVSEVEEKKFSIEIKDRNTDELPEGEVLIRVHYSSLNYKDALSATGNKGVTRNFPHTPGIDAAGVVEESSSDSVKAGDKVIVTGYDLGMNTSGGFADYIRVPADWVVQLPEKMTLREAMIWGTAGLTAGLSVNELIEKVRPEDGDILVTGASGGVGSTAVGILSRLGYSVTAVTGKVEEKDFFDALGAKSIISRDEILEGAGKPILKSRWAGVIDTVGGDILAAAVKSSNYAGTVTCCGNAASPDLPLNVFPFILRGVRLVGIDSQNCPTDVRTKVWEKLSDEWKLADLETVTTEVALEGLEEKVGLILQGKIKGRTLVKL